MTNNITKIAFALASSRPIATNGMLDEVTTHVATTEHGSYLAQYSRPNDWGLPHGWVLSYHGDATCPEDATILGSIGLQSASWDLVRSWATELATAHNRLVLRENFAFEVSMSHEEVQSCNDKFHRISLDADSTYQQRYEAAADLATALEDMMASAKAFRDLA